MELQREKKYSQNSVRLSFEGLRLGEYQLRSVMAQVSYQDNNDFCIETFECDLHNALLSADEPVIRLTAANVTLTTVSRHAHEDDQQSIRLLHIGHLRIQPLASMPDAPKALPSHVTECRLEVVTHQDNEEIYTEVVMTPDSVMQQQHGSGCGIAVLTSLIRRVLQIPVVIRNREYESYLKGVSGQLVRISGHSGESRAREIKIARHMTANLVAEIIQLEQRGDTELAASLLRRMPLAALQLLLPSSGKGHRNQLIELLLLLHRIQPLKAVALLMTEVKISAFDWQSDIETETAQLLRKALLSPASSCTEVSCERKNSLSSLLLSLSNRMLVDECSQSLRSITYSDPVSGSSGGLAAFFSLIQVVKSNLKNECAGHDESFQLKQAIDSHMERHVVSGTEPPVIQHYERLFRVTHSPDVLAVLTLFYQAGAFHLQRLETLLFNEPLNHDLALLVTIRNVLAAGDKTKAISLLLKLSYEACCGIIGEYFRHIKGQLSLKTRVLDALSRQHTEKEQSRLLRLLPETVLSDMVAHYLLKTELTCIDRLLDQAAGQLHKISTMVLRDL